MTCYTVHVVLCLKITSLVSSSYIFLFSPTPMAIEHMGSKDLFSSSLIGCMRAQLSSGGEVDGQGHGSVEKSFSSEVRHVPGSQSIAWREVSKVADHSCTCSFPDCSTKHKHLKLDNILYLSRPSDLLYIQHGLERGDHLAM